MQDDKLSIINIMLVGFMTFCFLVGAGNIIFPPFVGIEAGSYIYTAGFGFLISAVGLPVLTLVALAKVGGGIDELSKPLGKFLALIFAIVCYLAVGPLFATPRTAATSFDIGISKLPFLQSMTPTNALLSFTIVYFLIVTIVALHPGKILDIIGKFLGPIKIIAILTICLAGLFIVAGNPAPATESYQQHALVNGLVNGYQTLDVLGALVFGIVIVNAIKSKQVTSTQALTKYTIYAGIIAGIGMIFIYVCLLKLGLYSYDVIPDKEGLNGAIILQQYIAHVFGIYSSYFLASLITITCLVTAIGLTCACAEFFSAILPLSYRNLVLLLSIFSVVVANAGLTQIINFSYPVLVAIYPVCIMVVVLSFFTKFMCNPSLIMIPAVLIALVIGITDTFTAEQLPAFINNLPGKTAGMGFISPCVVAILITLLIDKTIKKAS